MPLRGKLQVFCRSAAGAEAGLIQQYSTYGFTFTSTPLLPPPIMCPTEAVASGPVDASEFVAVAEKDVSAQEVAQATAPIRPSGPTGPYSGRSSDFLSNVSLLPARVCAQAGSCLFSRGTVDGRRVDGGDRS